MSEVRIESTILEWKAGTIALPTGPGFRGVPPESASPPTQFFFGTDWNHISIKSW